MNMPPPPKRKFKVYPMDEMMLTEAVFVFGGYPQVPWADAVRNVRRELEGIGEYELRPTALFRLGRRKFGRHYPFIEKDEAITEMIRQFDEENGIKW